jgi:hypothetical protein
MKLAVKRQNIDNFKFMVVPTFSAVVCHKNAPNQSFMFSKHKNSNKNQNFFLIFLRFFDFFPSNFLKIM